MADALPGEPVSKSLSDDYVAVTPKRHDQCVYSRSIGVTVGINHIVNTNYFSQNPLIGP